MKQFKSFLSVAIALVVLSSCGVGDLEDRLDKVEGALGTSEPLKVNFSTTNYNDEAVVNKTSYLFKAGGDNEYIWDYQDGTYYVYIERGGSVEMDNEGSEGAWIDFYYDPETKEVSGQRAGTYFRDQYSSYRYPSFYEGYDGCEIEIVVNSFNANTGKVRVTVTANTTSSYSYNTFEGEAMSMTMSFSGKLPVFIGGD